MKKKLFNILVACTSLIMLFTFIVKTQGLTIFFRQLLRLSPLWILGSLLLMLLYWYFESLALHIITSFHGVKKKMRESFSVTMVGQFFNSITPFAAGGQPAQVVYLVKNGVDTGNASSIVMIKFFIFQSVLTLYSLLVIILSFKFFSAKIPLLLTMTCLGLAVHASMIFLTILFTYNKTLTEKILKFAFKVLKKIRIVKFEDIAEKKLEDSLSNFHHNASLLKNNLGLLFRTSILMFVQLTFFLSIPYCIYRSFALSATSYFELFAAAVFVATVISIVPLPGSTGGAEIGFFTFFGLFFDSTSIVPAILIWRIITYYSCIGFGGLFAMFLPKKAKRAGT